ncbi:MAG: hypothetical protein ACK2T0_12915 [Anaerolineales bacterium]
MGSSGELKEGRVTSAAFLGISSVVAGLLLALLINHHWLYPDFRLLPGDRGDTRLVIFTLEHWVSVLKGREPFYVLGMFYPDQHALGYADGLFLFAIPYALFRFLGWDYFTSYQLLFVAMTALGYFAWLLLLRRALRLQLGFAILGATLLTCLNALQVQAQIGKLSAFYAYPVLLGLLVVWHRSRDKRSWKAWTSILLFAILLGLLFFTSYYPAWFFAFTALLYAVVAATASSARRGVQATWKSILRFLASNRWQLLAGAGALLLSLIPFAITYAPLVAANATRSFNLVLEFSPHPLDIFNVSVRNYIWSPILQAAGFKFGNVEVQMGSPAIVLILALGVYLSQLLSLVRHGFPSMSGRRGFMFLLSTTALAIFVLIVQIRGTSLWYIIYETIPGASALRALGRYLIVVDMIIICMSVWGLNELYLQRGGGRGRSQYILAALVVLSAALVAEEANGTPYRLDKHEQLALLDKYQQPESWCRTFFVSNADSDNLPAGYYELDAMMISMKLGLPTINGYSGFTPSAAFSLVPQGPEYEYRILQWLHGNAAEQGICELDMQSVQFRRVDVAAELPGSEQQYRASLLDSFTALYSAASRFVADGHDLSNLYPQFLEENGYLDPALGYQAGKAYKWMQNRYWIGERSCPRGKCLGIGVVGQYADIRDIIARYGPLAERILFPEPERFDVNNPPPSDAQGELLMIFPAAGLVR